MSNGTSQKLADAGKYLTFKLGDETYGVEILRVSEIIGVLDITRVPHAPYEILGVINLRGKVIPVISLRRKFGFSDIEETNLTCTIVIELGGTQIGILVDEVSEVFDMAASQIEPPPAMGGSVDTSFICGIGKLPTRIVLLLDIVSVLDYSSNQQVEA